MSALLTALVCWLGFCIAVLLAAVGYSWLERRFGGDPLERIWRLPAREPRRTPVR